MTTQIVQADRYILREIAGHNGASLASNVQINNAAFYGTFAILDTSCLGHRMSFSLYLQPNMLGQLHILRFKHNSFMGIYSTSKMYANTIYYIYCCC